MLDGSGLGRFGSIRYLPKGFGSYHWSAETTAGGHYFVTVDDLTSKPWLSPNPSPAHAMLSGCYRAASLLYDAGLTSVVPPIADTSGSVCRRLTERYSAPRE